LGLAPSRRAAARPRQRKLSQAAALILHHPRREPIPPAAHGFDQAVPALVVPALVVADFGAQAAYQDVDGAAFGVGAAAVGDGVGQEVAGDDGLRVGDQIGQHVELGRGEGGAAAVVGLMKALAGRKAKVNAVGIIGLAENMPSGTAQRPGDVVKSMSGQTIEVINTDAEGRLILADVLWYTQDRFKPEAMIDLATLTGAIIVALGHNNAGLFATDDALAERLLAAGIGDCYELGRVFRDGEAGRHHNPEFTLLEWYRIGWDHRRLMDEVSELVALAMADAGRPVSVERLSYAALYQRHCGLDPHLADDQALVAALGDIRLDATGLGRDDWLDLLMTHRIQPELPDSRLTLVYDYPAGQCALARLRPGTPPLAERFEAYLGPLELANGFHELADAQEQRVRFIADQAIRSARGRPSPPLDENLLAALGHGLPNCAGVALGIDRLLMAMQGAESISEVLAFPSDRS